MIPRIIHYCRFGDAPMSKIERKCLSKLKQLSPKFRIKKWDDGLLPTNRYVVKARSNGEFANVANFMRLWALYHFGGIYVDTDIEIMKDLDPLLSYDCFFGAESSVSLNNVIIGARPRHPFIRELLWLMEVLFDGTELAHVSGPNLVTMALKAKSTDEFNSHIAEIAGITIFPHRYFYPYHWSETLSMDCVTEDTYTIHHWARMHQGNIGNLIPASND